MTTQHVQGLDELLATLKALPPSLVSKRGGPVRAALRKAAVVIQLEARANVRRIVAEPNKGGRDSISTGTLELAIIVSRKKPPPGQKGERFHIRVKRGAKAPNGVTANKYGGILEFDGKPWLRTAFETKKGEALDLFVAELRKGLDRAVRNARRGFKVLGQ